jgi:preprotein translocase subunit SecG
MYTFLLVLLVLVSIILIVAILLQSGTGQGLSASFGGASSSPDSFIGVRQAGNLLTRISWWGGGLFLALAFILQLMSTQQRAPKSVLEGKLGTPAPVTVPSPSSAAPAIPLTPANPTSPAGQASPAPAKTAPATTPPKK